MASPVVLLSRPRELLSKRLSLHAVTASPAAALFVARFWAGLIDHLSRRNFFPRVYLYPGKSRQVWASYRPVTHRYHGKPVIFEEFRGAARRIAEDWLRLKLSSSQTYPRQAGGEENAPAQREVGGRVTRWAICEAIPACPAR